MMKLTLIKIQILAAKFTDQQRLELTPNHKNSIHLWQFLAELLNQDKWTCIKWIQRDKGNC